MKKRIGVLTHKGADGSISISAAYTNWANHFGTVVPVFALDDKVRDDIDVLILIGGADVNPIRYTNDISMATQNPNMQLEWFDHFMLPEYINRGIGLMAICRGAQTINVTLGGQLTQHINQEYSNPRGELKDKLVLAQGSRDHMANNNLLHLLRGLPTNHRFEVNSLHHQGFYMDQCGNGVVPLFINDKFQNVEAFTVANKPIFGCQYHPEEIYDQFSTNAMNHLLNN